jgi:hypothetical protein
MGKMQVELQDKMLNLRLFRALLFVGNSLRNKSQTQLTHFNQGKRRLNLFPELHTKYISRQDSNSVKGKGRFIQHSVFRPSKMSSFHILYFRGLQLDRTLSLHGEGPRPTCDSMTALLASWQLDRRPDLTETKLTVGFLRRNPLLENSSLSLSLSVITYYDTRQTRNSAKTAI